MRKSQHSVIYYVVGAIVIVLLFKMITDRKENSDGFTDIDASPFMGYVVLAAIIISVLYMIVSSNTKHD